MKIYKYELGIEGITVMVQGHIRKILNVQWQGYNPVVWCEVDDNVPEVRMMIYCLGTGWNVGSLVDGCEYIGTAQEPSEYVWHYYRGPMEEVEKPQDKYIDVNTGEAIEAEEGMTDEDLEFLAAVGEFTGWK